MKCCNKQIRGLTNQTSYFLWRKVRDSNPRMLSHLMFSRHVPSTTRPTFRVKIAEKSAIFYSVLRFYKFKPLDLQFVEKFVEFTAFMDSL